MEILSIATKEINPAEYNPRKDLQPGDPEYDKLKKSILEFDMVEPLVWNKQTGNLVGGHQRLKILKELGVKKVDVSVVDLSPVKEKALNIALNKIQGEWDFPRLKDLLQELDTGDFDMEITGFDEQEIEDLMTQFHVPTDGLTEDDAIPGKVETICKTGDLWQLGNHRLLCGDAIKKEDVARLMGGGKADMVFTDPPYNENFSGGIDKKGNKSKRGANVPILGDKVTRVEFKQFCVDILLTIKSFTIGGWYICHYRLMTDVWMDALRETNANWKSIIIWKKNRPALSPLDYHNNYEPILYGYERHQFYGGKVQSDVWEFPRPIISDLHPVMKPVELCATAINNSSLIGQTVLDLFGGSGSTLIACEKLSRRCFMMEIDEHYCDVIIQRWQNFTGKQAEKLND